MGTDRRHRRDARSDRSGVRLGGRRLRAADPRRECCGRGRHPRTLADRVTEAPRLTAVDAGDVAEARSRRRQLDPCQHGEGRRADEHGRRAGHHAVDAHAARDEVHGQRRRSVARRPGAAGAQRARAAGKRHARAHAADQLRVQPLSAHGARPEPAARQAGRAEGDRRPDRARQDGDGEDRRSARAPGAQQRRPRHRDAAGARRGRQAGGRRRLAGGLSQGRQHRRRSLRRRRRLAARTHPREGARARPGRRERHARPKSRSTT